jgi:adenylate cyclase
MTVPLLHSDELLGLMHLDSQYATNAFTEKDLQICTGMAAQAAIAIQNARLVTRIEKEAQTRAQFSRLIPPAVVEQVVKGELKLDRGGRLSEITMLYSDIRGFTKMAEGRPPADVVNTLNEYFEVMVDVLFQHSGTLDKFVGDEIIGLFGAPLPIEDAPLKAATCALAMMKGLEEFNHTRAAENLDPIHIGIGINTGRVITGAIGSTRAMQYTAIGDAMNMASRLVGHAKPGEIILSAETYNKIAYQVEAEPLGLIELKGIAKPQKLYRLIDLKGTHEWGGPTHA